MTDAATTPGFSIAAPDGSILVRDTHRLVPGQTRAEIEAVLSPWLSRTSDHGNGYEWLYLDGLMFGGAAATLALCLHDGRLSQAAWSANLPGAPRSPTRDSIKHEVRFVRTVLSREVGFMTSAASKTFPWGEIWSRFDPKGATASHGLRYNAV